MKFWDRNRESGLEKHSKNLKRPWNWFFRDQSFLETQSTKAGVDFAPAMTLRWRLSVLNASFSCIFDSATRWHKTTFCAQLEVLLMGRCSLACTICYWCKPVCDSCVILLAGDYHISDLKMVEPGSDTLYSKHYPTSSLKKPIYQLSLQVNFLWLTKRPCAI